MPNTDPIRITTEVDLEGLSGFTAGAQKAGAAAAEMAQKFMQSGLSAKEAAAALVNLGYAEKEAAAAAGVLVEMQPKVATQGTQAMSALGRATAMASARIAGELVPGLGMAGYQIGRMASYLPGLGQLFVLALPVALIAMAVQQITAYEEALEKTRNEMSQFAVSARDAAGAVDVENLKLEDQIRKLEGRPTQNAVAIALEEVRIKADQVAESIAKDLDKLEQLLKAGTGLGAEMFLGSANEDAVGKALAPINRAYQIAVFAKDTEGQRNALLQAQATIERAITDEKQKQAQFDALQKIPVSEGALGTGITGADQKALQDYREALSGINSLLKEQSAAAVNSSLVVKAAQLSQISETESFWEKYSVGFKEASAELAKHQQMWKEFYAHQAEEAKKAEDDKAKIEEEGAARTAEVMARLSEQEAATNVANAREASAAVEDLERKRQVPSYTGAGAFSGMAKYQQGKSQMAEVEAEMRRITEAMNQLRADAAQIQAKPLLTDADQKSVRSYTEEISRLQEQLDRLAASHQKLAIDVGTTTQHMQTMFQTSFDSMNQAVIRFLETGKSFGREMQQVWNQLAGTVISAGMRTVEQMIVNAAEQKSILDSTKLADAAAAARHTFASVSAIPFIGWVLAPEAAAAAFAAVLAFEQGGLVPGSVGNAVPIMAHAQEMVLPANVSNWVMRAAGADSAPASPGGNFHFHSNVSAVDGDGIDRILEKHSEKFFQAAKKALRRRAA